MQRIMHRKKVPAETRFWGNVVRGAKDDCWIWTGAKARSGHGVISVDGHTEGAHRFSYRTHKGEIPLGLMIRHLCGNPSCVNPDHLATGTAQDNMDDKVIHRSIIYEMAGLDEQGRIKDSLTKLAQEWGLADFEIEDIWQEIQQGRSIGKIAKYYRVDSDVIARIRNLKKGIAPRTVKEQSQSYRAVVA